MSADDEEPEAPDGIRRRAVTRWLADNVEAVEPPFRFEQIEGGRSNLTYRVEDASGRCLALRRPPLSHVLPSAHDMQREHRILAALAGTAVPTPQVLGICHDEDVTGAVFYVMEFVEGIVLRDVTDVEAALPPGARDRTARGFVEGLVGLHAVRQDQVGLSDLGPGTGYIRRQLDRWHEQLRRLDDRDVPLLNELHERLVGRIPPQQETTLVHGDYRLANAVIGPDGHLRAVLDWELCTLGDPLADVAWLLVYWEPPREGLQLPALSMPTTAPGFVPRDDLVEHYAKLSGRDLSALGFHVAFGYWKLAAILEGVRIRYRDGAYGERAAGADLGETVDALARAADEAAQREGI